MKTFEVKPLLGVGIVIGCLALPRAYAAAAPAVSDPDAQRAVIEETRRTETLRLDVLVRGCESKFAVTRCLDQVRAERLTIEAQLNRQETLLNDAQRHARGQEQLERNRERAAQHAQKVADLAGAAPAQAKQPKIAPQPGGAASVRPAADAKVPALSAQEREAHAKDYQRKQADAIAKRAEVARRIKDAGVKKPSLPKPE